MGGMGGMRGKRASVKQAQPDDSRLTRAAVGKKLGGCFGNGVELIAGQSHPSYAYTASSSVQRHGVAQSESDSESELARVGEGRR